MNENVPDASSLERKVRPLVERLRSADGIEQLSDLVHWAYTKLHRRTFNSMEDTLKLDEMKLLLEYGV